MESLHRWKLVLQSIRLQQIDNIPDTKPTMTATVPNNKNTP